MLNLISHIESVNGRHLRKHHAVKRDRIIFKMGAEIGFVGPKRVMVLDVPLQSLQ